jgi:predicted Zn-dependent protease
LLCLGLTLSACGNMARLETASPSSSTAPAKPNRAVVQTPASEREHVRILSSYGGTYDDPKLEALIGKTVDRLVAASDRPDQPYKVTILNSGAVNAFALPTGQLYVTRGLVALASDTSELSSVCMRWRMCCQARLDQGGPGAAGGGSDARRHRHEQRSRFDGAGPGKNQIDDGELLPPSGVRG